MGGITASSAKLNVNDGNLNPLLKNALDSLFSPHSLPRVQSYIPYPQ